MLTSLSKVEGETKELCQQLINGVRNPFYSDIVHDISNLVLDSKQFQTKPGDVFIVSYPKQVRRYPSVL